MIQPDPQPRDAGAAPGKPWKGLVVLTGIYVGLTLFSAIQHHVWDSGTAHPSTWPQSLVKGLQWPTPWYFLTPLLLAVDDRIQATGRSIWVRVALHAGGMGLAFLPFAVLTFLVETAGMTLLRGWAWTRLHGPHPFSNLLAHFLEVPFMYCTVLLANAAIRQARARREGEVRAAKLAGRLSEARLALLQRQIHPHFLFNALQAVSTLLHRDPAQADAVLVRLSGLLRSLLDQVGTGETSLRLELEMTRRYLEIEEMRFQDRLTVAWDVDDDLQEARVPALVLLPLVENAIRHGLSPKIGPGRLDISVRREGPALRFSVDDDGLGATFPIRPGVGLGNTRERLEALYGEAGTLGVEARAGGGFHACVRLPLREGRP